MLCWLSSPVAEATDGKLKCFVGVNVKVSGLQGWMIWLAGICVSVIVLMYSLAAGAGGCGC